MITIFKALIAAVEKYIGSVDEASLREKKPGRSYTKDGIEISGIAKNGRKFRLELTVEDGE